MRALIARLEFAESSGEDLTAPVLRLAGGKSSLAWNVLLGFRT
jgi:hypothetical protein